MHIDDKLLSYGIAALAMSLLAGLCGCRSAKRETDPESLAASANARNIALIATGTSEQADPGRELNISLMASAFSDARLAFSPVVLRAATKRQLLDALEEQARAVGNDGTLLFYWNTHGSPRATYATSDGLGVSFQEILERLHRARSEKAMKRIVFLLDTCHAGSAQPFVGALRLDPGDTSGFSSATLGVKAPEIDPLSEADPGALSLVRELDSELISETTALPDPGSGGSEPERARFYEEALILSSSVATQETVRGRFAQAIGASLASLRPDATVKDLVNEVAARTSVSQTMTYKTFPSTDLLDEALFFNAAAERPAGSANAVIGNMPTYAPANIPTYYAPANVPTIAYTGVIANAPAQVLVNVPAGGVIGSCLCSLDRAGRYCALFRGNRAYAWMRSNVCNVNICATYYRNAINRFCRY